MKTNKYFKGLCALILLCALFASCSTDEDFFYQDEPRVRLVGEEIWAVGTDSVTFSFVAYASDVTEKTIYVDAQVMGNVADHDRTVIIEVDPQLTTASTAQYTAPTSVVIPAGQAKGTFPVVLRRDASLQSKTVTLYLKVTANSDFKPGVNEENHIRFIWNDILSRPNNWSDLEPFFGAYSDVKYRFMLTNSDGAGDFSTETMSWAQLMSYKIRFQNALNEYNAAHPGNPLTDEYGNLVTFE